MSDCPGHAALSDVDSGASLVVDTDADVASGHCTACNACQICHGAALANAVMVQQAELAPDALPIIGSTRFTSAASALGQKPPIS